MRLGLTVGYHHQDPQRLIQIAQGAEALGFDSIWTSEAYGYDALTPLVWMAAHTRRIKVGTAILQMPARTPAMTAMSAASVDFLTGGRFLLGLGVSGPQVVEGWHGVPFGKPLGRSREYLGIIRSILRREEPLRHRGEHYTIPIEGGTGLGKPLKLIEKPLRGRIPIYLAALGPGNVALAAEVADGWLPILFSPLRKEVFAPSIKEGLRKAGGGKSLEDLDIAPTVQVVVGDDLDSCRLEVKKYLALYAGGMGAKAKNFYNDLIGRYGYRDAAAEIQDLYLQGRKQEAAAAVPDELVDEVSLCGPRERVVELFEDRWRPSGITTLICMPNGIPAAQIMASLV